MVKRELWITLIESSWKKRSIIWLAGVRRVGKTYLCKSLDSIEYYNCELPRIQEQLEDPEQFFLKAGKRIVLDEIHVLKNPALVLKIAADEFPQTKIIATGSSTLSARKKFTDTLTGRKINLHMTPLLFQEGAIFGNTSLEHRMLAGGLPPFFLQSSLDETSYHEWFSSYFARDVQKLYRVDNEAAFLRFAQLILTRSGGLFDATKFAQETGVSRPSIQKYLHLLEQTYVVYSLRPYNSRSSAEIIKMPKIYGFDTGFICYTKQWLPLRTEDCGHLWKHILLNNLVGQLQTDVSIYYWKDKQGHEVDFVIKKSRNHKPMALETKWNHKTFDVTNIRHFRKRYPEGKNFVVAPSILETFTKKFDDLEVIFISLPDLMVELG